MIQDGLHAQWNGTTLTHSPLYCRMTNHLIDHAQERGIFLDDTRPKASVDIDKSYT